MSQLQSQLRGSQVLPTQLIEVPISQEPTDNAWGILRSLNPNHPDVRLTTDVFTIGRSKDCTLRFDSATISFTHVKIRRVVGPSCSAATAVVEDNSSNGTFVNGKRLIKNKVIPLLSGQRLTLVVASPEMAKKSPALCDNFVSYLYETAGRGPVPASESDERDLDKVFDVRDILGAGHFATVKLAVHRRTGANVAIKIIDKRKFMMNPNLKVEHLRAEVEILKSLDHPNVIRLYDVYETERYLNLVMELVSGGDLFDRVVETGPMTEKLARRVFRQILEALKYVHSQGVVHRDLKPENIFLASFNEDADIKVGDFGLAKIVGAESEAQTYCGTPQYFAPEVLFQQGKKGSSGKGYGKAVDMWSAGVILYILISAKPPFYERKTPPSLHDQIREAKFKFYDGDWRHVSEGVKNLIRALLVVDPKKRLTVEQALAHPWMQIDAPAESTRKRSGAADLRDTMGDTMRDIIRPPPDRESPSTKARRKSFVEASPGASTSSVVTRTASAVAAAKNKK